MDGVEWGLKYSTNEIVLTKTKVCKHLQTFELSITLLP